MLLGALAPSFVPTPASAYYYHHRYYHHRYYHHRYYGYRYYHHRHRHCWWHHGYRRCVCVALLVIVAAKDERVCI
jgi:hypothetical protein